MKLVYLIFSFKFSAWQGSNFHFFLAIPLQLHSNFCDQVIVYIVRKDNRCFWNWSQNARCVVVKFVLYVVYITPYLPMVKHFWRFKNFEQTLNFENLRIPHPLHCECFWMCIVGYYFLTNILIKISLLRIFLVYILWKLSIFDKVIVEV